jgi:hypothetical protein
VRNRRAHAHFGVRGLLARLVGLLEGDIGAGRGEQKRGVRRRSCHRVDNDRQRAVVDGDELGGVLGLRGGRGDHDGDDLADEPDDIGGERHAVVIAGDELAEGRVEHLRCLDVGSRQHRDDAGRGCRIGHVDPVDPRVRDVRADEDSVQGTFDVEICRVVLGAAQ